MEELDEADVQDWLSSFECGRNPDIEEFLRRRAIPHEKSFKSRTYLLVDVASMSSGRPTILAFFSLAIHIMNVPDPISNSLHKRLHGLYFSKDVKLRALPCYLIGQLGKDDRYPERTTGDELLKKACQTVLGAQHAVGGRFIKIDCEDIPALVDLYQRNGFRAVQNDVSSGLLEMVLFF